MKNALKIFSFLLLFFLAYVFYVYFSFDKIPYWMILKAVIVRFYTIKMAKF
ncbi:hypothetical protein K708_0816 [Campylobacter coli JL-CDD-LMH]|nr:hypothetical protein K708_0816 [Campylobacter coli JL-CDD-LMH]